MIFDYKVLFFNILIAIETHTQMQLITDIMHYALTMSDETNEHTDLKK